MAEPSKYEATMLPSPCRRLLWRVVLTNLVRMLTFIVMECDKIIWGVYEFGVGWDSSVGIATRYGLDGPENESRWGQDIPDPSRPALGPTQPPIQWVPSHSRWLSGRGLTLTKHHI